MKQSNRRIRRSALAVTMLVAVVGLTACAGFRVERDGRKTGDAICDLKSASTTDEAKDALADAQKWVDKATKITGRPVSEDMRDIDENLSDLVEHASQGNSNLAQQDIAAIRRNAQAVVDKTSGHAERFYQGVDEGLSNCSD